MPIINLSKKHLETILVLDIRKNLYQEGVFLMAKQTIKPLAAACGLAFMASVAAAPAVFAGQNPFQADELSSGYSFAGHHGEGKCGEGKCGDEKAEGEGKCGSEKVEAEGSCGEEKAESEGTCGGEKAEAEGKCGEPQ